MCMTYNSKAKSLFKLSGTYMYAADEWGKILIVLDQHLGLFFLELYLRLNLIWQVQRGPFVLYCPLLHTGNGNM